jgi:hypothetical protein
MPGTDIVHHPIHPGRGATAAVVAGPTAAVFIIAGWGTQHRPRTRSG